MPLPRRIPFLLVFLLALGLVPAIGAAQDAAPPATYDPMIDSAVTEFAAGRWQEARALFLEAHALYPNARTLRGIGMTSYELRDYPEAVRNLEAALLETRRPLTDEQRTQVNALLDQARAFIGRFLIPAAPAGARLYVDDLGVDPGASWPAEPTAIVLGVGDHVIEIRAQSGAVATARLAVRGRTDAPLDIDLTPLNPAVAPRTPPPSGAAPTAAVDPAPFVVLGVGLGVALAGGILYGVGLIDIGTVQMGGRDWTQLAPAYERAPILTGVGAAALGLGLGAAVIGAIWAIVAGMPPARSDPHRTLRMVMAPSGPLSLGVEGSF